MNTRTRSGQAADWLEARLAHGPVAHSVIHAEATALGYGKSTVRRAANRIGIISEAQPQWPRQTTWRLP